MDFKIFLILCLSSFVQSVCREDFSCARCIKMECYYVKVKSGLICVEKLTPGLGVRRRFKLEECDAISKDKIGKDNGRPFARKEDTFIIDRAPTVATTKATLEQKTSTTTTMKPVESTFFPTIVNKGTVKSNKYNESSLSATSSVIHFLVPKQQSEYSSTSKPDSNIPNGQFNLNESEITRLNSVVPAATVIIIIDPIKQENISSTKSTILENSSKQPRIQIPITEIPLVSDAPAAVSISQDSGKVIDRFVEVSALNSTEFTKSSTSESQLHDLSQKAQADVVTEGEIFESEISSISTSTVMPLNIILQNITPVSSTSNSPLFTTKKALRKKRRRSTTTTTTSNPIEEEERHAYYELLSSRVFRSPPATTTIKPAKSSSPIAAKNEQNESASKEIPHSVEDDVGMPMPDKMLQIPVPVCVNDSNFSTPDILTGTKAGNISTIMDNENKNLPIESSACTLKLDMRMMSEYFIQLFYYYYYYYYY